MRKRKDLVELAVHEVELSEEDSYKGNLTKFSEHTDNKKKKQKIKVDVKNINNKKQNIKLVPWFNWSEWNYVYSLAFDPKTANEAVKRIHTWQSRGKIPLAIEATGNILEIMINDDGHDNQIRLLYSMAILRFVNGIVDHLQKGFYAMSISNLAKTVNLPQFLVDLRHDATHKEIPSYEALKLAAKSTLLWIKENYWKKQSMHLIEIQKRLTELINQYVEIQRDKVLPHNTKKSSSIKIYKISY